MNKEYKISQETIQKITEMKETGLTCDDISSALGISKPTVVKYLKNQRIEQERANQEKREYNNTVDTRARLAKDKQVEIENHKTMTEEDVKQALLLALRASLVEVMIRLPTMSNEAVIELTMSLLKEVNKSES